MVDAQPSRPAPGVAYTARRHRGITRRQRPRAISVADVVVADAAVKAAQGSATTSEPSLRTAWTRIVAAELLDQFLVEPDDAVATLDARLAKGNLLRRLLVDSKGSLSVTFAAHGARPI